MKLEHAALYVEDLEAAKEFFISYFGAKANNKYHNKTTGFQSYFLSFEPMDGRSAGVPMDGQAAAEPKDGRSAGAPMDGQAAAEPKDGRSAGAPMDGQAAAEPKDGQAGCRLEIMTRPNLEPCDNLQNRRGFIHLAFSTGSKEAVDALTERLKRDGYSVLSGPRTTGDGYYESCVAGIEGNQIEITV